MTVVVPVRGRITALRELLASYAIARAHCAEPTELVVVDDTSSPESADGSGPIRWRCWRCLPLALPVSPRAPVAAVCCPCRRRAARLQ
jgi:hypothetical protein